MSRKASTSVYVLILLEMHIYVNLMQSLLYPVDSHIERMLHIYFYNLFFVYVSALYFIAVYFRCCILFILVRYD